MTSRVKSLSIPKELENLFYRRLQKIKEVMSMDLEPEGISDSKAIVWLVLNSPKILQEAKMLRRIFDDIEAYQALWEKEKQLEGEEYLWNGN